MAGAADDDSLNYIFLDVISSGLGGAILLGVILAIPKSPKPTTLTAAPYLTVRATVTDTGNPPKPDLDARPNLWIQAPGQPDGFDLPLEAFDPCTGRSRSAASIPQFAAAGVTDSQLFLTGYFRHADGAADLIPVADEAQAAFYEFQITRPPPGKWTFKMRYQNRRGLTDLVVGRPPPIRVSLTAHAAGSAKVDSNPTPELAIPFADFSTPVSVTLSGGAPNRAPTK
jgi:hypothetical protein